MTDALGNHQSTVSIGGRTITNLRFADDIDGFAGDEQELANVLEHPEETSTSYGMEISIYVYVYVRACLCVYMRACVLKCGCI